MSRNTLLSLFIFLFPWVLMSQDFYYSLDKQIPLIDSENQVVIMIDETDPSMVNDAIENVWFIDEFKSIFASRGIFQFNILQGLSLDAAEIELNRIFNVIKRIPAFYQIDFNGDKWDMIMADEFVVKFGPDVTEEQIIALNSEHNVEIMSYSPWLGYLLRVTENSQLNALEIANLYYENPLTVWSHPNFVAEVRFEQISDTFFTEQWYLDNSNPSQIDIDAVRAWGVITGSSDIIVGVIDSGVEEHEDLPAEALVQGYDAGTGLIGGGPTSIAHRHGQCVAGIIAARHNTIGVRGLADNVKIMPIQIFNWGEVPPPDPIKAQGIADAINWAWQQGADILNMSFKTVEFDVISQSIRDALQYGRDGKGTMVVKSSGNTEGGGVTYPGTVPGVLVVGAVDRYGDPQYYTASDPEVDVVAPSSEYGPCDYNDIGIWSIDRDPYGYSPNFCDEYHGDNEGKYFSNFTGTSAAAPQVAGIGALLLSLDPSLEARAVGPDKNPELQDIIKESAIDLGDYDWAGHGLVNAYYAVAPPAAPQNLTLTNEGGNPRLNWDANTEPDLDKYHVYKRLTYNCPPTCDTENFMFITDENTYIDNGFDIGGRPPFDLAEYWIKAVDIGGQESSSSNSVIKPGHQTAQWKELVEMAPNVPEDYNLSANSPNPFNPVTTIRYDLPEVSHVSLVIYDILGREVRTLLDNREDTGFKRVVWDGKDNSGNIASAGIYIYALRAWSQESEKTYHKTQKMVLLR